MMMSRLGVVGVRSALVGCRKWFVPFVVLDVLREPTKKSQRHPANVRVDGFLFCPRLFVLFGFAFEARHFGIEVTLTALAHVPQ